MLLRDSLMDRHRVWNPSHKLLIRQAATEQKFNWFLYRMAILHMNLRYTNSTRALPYYQAIAGAIHISATFWFLNCIQRTRDYLYLHTLLIRWPLRCLCLAASCSARNNLPHLLIPNFILMLVLAIPNQANNNLWNIARGLNNNE